MNPLNWLPKPGEYKKIPGGVIGCESWEVQQRFGEMEGKIVFRFHTDISSYREAMTEVLPDKSLRLDKPKGTLPNHRET